MYHSFDPFEIVVRLSYCFNRVFGDSARLKKTQDIPYHLFSLARSFLSVGIILILVKFWLEVGEKRKFLCKRYSGFRCYGSLETTELQSCRDRSHRINRPYSSLLRPLCLLRHDGKFTIVGLVVPFQGFPLTSQRLEPQCSITSRTLTGAA